ncbi:hypothetical protein K435DRAFT_741256 [Dendrothele bispora CBS 962.96]|uniref:UFSP1/2/DUB catalytic domain-containing protein n=1 Tax=Dendrothele bispora (strain CBS 962.96) TaxID=1314807 RepID=A0A4S8MXM1_DENBC|nr:hypothetical protein K435DRAFT_741256 [Dendrothele bispora CBS 962.96]
MNCQICFESLGGMSPEDRGVHYNTHFRDEQQGQANSSSYRPYGVLKPSLAPKSSSGQQFGGKPSATKKWTPLKFMEDGRDVFWYPSLQTPPPSNFTPCMIPLLKKALLKSHAKGTTLRAVLCYDRAVYICRQNWDITWGCGYRNFLMSCAALMDQQVQPMYFPLLDKPIAPGIRNLQRWIETAWKDGFDQQGFNDLKKLMDTSKWIGTSDLCTAFVYRNIPAEIVDIDLQERDITPLIDWIVQYFDESLKDHTPGSATVFDVLSRASPVQCSSCMPIVIQNNGHSRMVVGYERTKNDVNLLVFDPAKVPSKSVRQAALSIFNSPKSPASSGSTSNPNQPSKRRIPDSPFASSSKSNSASTPNKRSKKEPRMTGGREENVIFVDDGPIVIDDSDDEVVIVSETKAADRKKISRKRDEEPAYTDVLRLLRWENKSVKRKNQYQILYFPMTAPLTETERMSKKVLTGERF